MESSENDMETRSLFYGFSTAASRRIYQWSMRVIQLIKIFYQIDIKQHNPADDEEDRNVREA
jgi:hypothetical protein